MSKAKQFIVLYRMKGRLYMSEGMNKTAAKEHYNTFPDAVYVVKIIKAKEKK